MRVLEYRNGAPIAALEAGVGPYRLRQTGDAAWPPKARAYGGEDPSLWPRLLPLALAALVLLLPVTLLSVLLAAAYLYADAVLPASSFPVALQDVTFTIGDLVLPGAWAAVHLTNRRYGAPYAFAQLTAALAVAALVMLVNPGDIDDWVAFMPSLTTRAVLAFGVSFLAANFIAITVFDGLRGPSWWTAPLAGSIAATLVFSLLYYPLAFAGIDAHWLDAAATHGALFLTESVLLLLPYWLLRPAMRPLPGLNGY